MNGRTQIESCSNHLRPKATYTPTFLFSFMNGRTQIESCSNHLRPKAIKLMTSFLITCMHTLHIII